MKASEVRVLPALDPGESYVDPNFLLVETMLDEDGDGVTTIDHVRNRAVNGKERWDVTTLGQSVPMTHESAREWAVSYAASRDIPLVYERDQTLAGPYAAASSSSESAARRVSK
jgi:hypothetical protein